MRGALIWLATLLSIATTTLRALNVGRTSALYGASSVAYAIMVWDDWPERRRVLLNGFYLLTSLIAVVRWA